MDIIVPDAKSPLPHPRSPYVNVVRTLGTVGFVGFVLLFAMIFSEGNIRFPHLQRLLEFVGISFLGFLVTLRVVRLGGMILAAGMVLSLFFTTIELREWRAWFFALEAYMALVGILFLLARGKRTGE